MCRLLISVVVVFAFQTAAAMAQRIIGDNAAVQAASRATTVHRLTPVRTECLYFDTHDEGRTYLVRVREKHDKFCGGLTTSSPVLYYMHIQKDDGRITTTAYDPDNTRFQPLKPARSDPPSDIAPSP